MKGVKTMSLANATSKRFQSDDIITQRVHLPGGQELVATLAQMKAENEKLSTALKEFTAIKSENANLTKSVKELSAQVKELQDKYDALDVE